MGAKRAVDVMQCEVEEEGSLPVLFDELDSRFGEFPGVVEAGGRFFVVTALVGGGDGEALRVAPQMPLADTSRDVPDLCEDLGYRLVLAVQRPLRDGNVSYTGSDTR